MNRWALGMGAALLVIAARPAVAAGRRPAGSDGLEAPRRERVEELPPDLFEKLPDKGAIARDHERRLAGIREQGSPHIPAGSALHEARYPGAPSEERRRALRERAVSLYDRRDPQWEVPRVLAPEVAPREIRRRPTPDNPRTSILTYISAGFALLGLSALLVQLRRAPR